jgi:ribonucleoside-diphosphate reductase alpha chain
MKAGGQSGGLGSPKSTLSAAAKATSNGNGSHDAPKQSKNGSHGKPGTNGAGLLERAGLVAPKWDAGELLAGPATRSDQFASFQTDAPTCDNCGAITVRNGNCYLCHNCGNSMGCS